MLLRVVLLLEIVLLVTATGGDRKRFCGDYLTESLQFFCRHRYASPQTFDDQKRSDSSTFSYQSLPFLASFRSAAGLRPRVRRDYWYLQRGVADECCRKPCTLQELKSYCY